MCEREKLAAYVSCVMLRLAATAARAFVSATDYVIHPGRKFIIIPDNNQVHFSILLLFREPEESRLFLLHILAAADENR